MLAYNYVHIKSNTANNMQNSRQTSFIGYVVFQPIWTLNSCGHVWSGVVCHRVSGFPSCCVLPGVVCCRVSCVPSCCVSLGVGFPQLLCVVRFPQLLCVTGCWVSPMLCVVGCSVAGCQCNGRVISSCWWGCHNFCLHEILVPFINWQLA